MIRTLFLLMALVAAACSSADGTTAVLDDPPSTDAELAETTTAPTTTTAAPTTTTTTTAPAFDMAAFEVEAREILDSWKEANGAPAVSLSIRLPDQEPLNLAFGVVDLQTDEPVSTESYFRIGSITKPMTSAIVLQLVDEGLVELDVPVRTYLPGWLEGHPHADDITIRQLLNHTNGLVEYALDPSFYAEAGTRLETAYEPEEIIEWLARQDPLFAPGEEYSYETGGFLSLGRVIENVTGNSAAAEMRTRIFDPAGAENIFLTPQEFPPEPSVHGYGRGLFYLASTAIIGRTDDLGLMINDEPVFDQATLPQDVLQSSGWTGGGNEAQAESVSAILQALFDGTILSPPQVAEMIAPALDTTTYGLGISNDVIDGTTVYSHGGGVPGFRSQAGYLPDHDTSYAVHASLIPLPEGGGVGDLQAELVVLLSQAATEIAAAG